MKYVTTEELAKLNGLKHIGENRSIACEADSVRLDLAHPPQLGWIGKPGFFSEAETIITTAEIAKTLPDSKTVLVCDNPRFEFAWVVNSALINHYEKPPRIIAKGAVINERASIGDRGEGWVLNPMNGWQPFPQVAGVSIYPGVSIGAFTSVKRGSLSDTLIGAGTKIGSHCSIGHSAKIGTDCLLMGNNFVCGSAQLGDRVQMGVGAIVTNGSYVPDDTFVKAGTVWNVKKTTL